ncbi:MAG TPA: beta-L-arabinofuranosidase domain-containing protein, partial [Gemmataceae bacterium]
MKGIISYSSLLVLATTVSFTRAEEKAGGLTVVPFQDVKIADSFWSPRIKTNRTATIEANLRQCEQTGRIKNFAVAAKLVEGKHLGALYNDSDVYKVLEGIAYTLAGERDAELEKRTDAIIDQIAAAQQPDGYLNTYFTLVEPKNRWKNIQFGHELYCAGHLIEAAVAYQQATGKGKFLEVACKLADHIDSVFGPGKKIDACGHEELELALVKLYRATNEKKYLKLAQFFLDTRGTAEGRKLFGEYAQDHKPIREQTEVTGHAVRAMYLYCGMADVANLTGDNGLLKALEPIWHDVVDRKMYITGGIGPSASNEGFTVPYDLPNDSAYAETCAAIGMALWNHRMFLMSGDGKYADILEREVYNGLISGVALDGEHFFYVNPLGSLGTHHRVEWFDCSCCPTNLVRYIPGMGERAFATHDNAIWTVLYLGNSANAKLKDGTVKLTEETRYPWDGEVKLTVDPESSFAFDLHLRVPGWCNSTPKITVNDKAVEAKAEHGYVTLNRTWKAGDEVRLSLPMPVERVHADPKVKADVGRVALQRGPVVYCVEGVDNDGKVRNLVLPKDAPLSASFEKNLLGGVEVIRGDALAVSRGDNDKLLTKPVKFQAVPYSTWDNRKPGPMLVWLPETPELAELPGEEGAVSANGMRIRASHVFSNDTLAELNDGQTPKSSKDHEVRRMTWWDHRGTSEWISYKFAKPRKVTESSVYWFDDTGVGQCRIPAEWRLLYKDGDDWKAVKRAEGSSFGTALDQFNKVTFEPVTTA